MKLLLTLSILCFYTSFLNAQLRVENLDLSKSSQTQNDFKTHITKTISISNALNKSAQINVKGNSNYLGERAWFCKLEDAFTKNSKAICSFRLGTLEACNAIEYLNRQD